MPLLSRWCTRRGNGRCHRVVVHARKLIWNRCMYEIGPIKVTAVQIETKFLNGLQWPTPKVQKMNFHRLRMISQWTWKNEMSFVCVFMCRLGAHYFAPQNHTSKMLQLNVIKYAFQLSGGRWFEVHTRKIENEKFKLCECRPRHQSHSHWTRQWHAAMKATIAHHSFKCVQRWFRCERRRKKCHPPLQK